MTDYPILRDKLGPDGLAELRRLIAEEVAQRGGGPSRPEPPARPGRIPGPDEDIRPRA